jgi:hypothetical protein
MIAYVLEVDIEKNEIDLIKEEVNLLVIGDKWV